jgi:hypothetical protein
MKYFIGIFIAAVVIGTPIFIGFKGLHIDTGSGKHTGYITAVEKTGVIYKTYTVYVKTDAQSSQEDKYCVIDPQLVGTLLEKSKARSLVTISYQSYLIAGLTNCSGEADVIVGLDTN